MAGTIVSPTETIRILLLEDSPADAALCIRKLKRAELNATIDLVQSSEEFIGRLRSTSYDVILTDYRLPDWTGLEALRMVRRLGFDTPVILVTGTLGDEVAIDCIKAGVSDYVLKENLERLPVAVRRAIDEHRLRQDYDRAELELRESEKQYRLLFNANPHPMWVFDRETLRFLTVNDAAIEHYGYSLKEFLSMTADELRPAEDVNRFIAAVRAPNRISTRELWRHKKKDGTIIDVEISSQIITFRAIEAVLVLSHDVTAQRRAEAEVREGREQLQLLLDSTAEAIYAIDVDGVCTLCNAACLRLLGYSHESEMVGRNAHLLIHHTRRDGQPHTIEECNIHQASLSGQGAHVSDEVLWRKDGTSFPVEYWSYPVRREGRIVGSVITFFDITDRHRTEEQLRLERERLALALKVGKSSTFEWNIRDNINIWSRESEELYGLDPGESGSTHEDWVTCILPEDLDRAKSDIEKSLKTGDFASEWRIRRRNDGQIRWIHSRAKVFFDDAGQPTYMVGIDVDITDRKKAEEQLRRSEAQYRSIIESAPYGIYRVEWDGRVVMANQALVRMLGYETHEEVLGLNTALDIYVDPTERERVISQFISKGPSSPQEAKWKCKDGRTITVRLVGRHFAAAEELRGGYEVFVEDVTDRIALQKQFEHAQRMEAVGRLAAGVAHDFNNVLMVVSGYAQLMEESPTNVAKVSDYAAQIQEASSKAAAITRQLLAFSRKQVLEPTFLNLNHIVTEMQKMLPRMVGEDVDVVFALDPKLGTVRADRGQIEQVIMNLAVNARDAMPRGGHLYIETNNVELEPTPDINARVSIPPGRYVLLTVGDNGIGMSPETQVHIFEPFFTTKEAGKGTGLGLATVYGIVKQSNGFISVSSELGKGTTFEVYLPRVDAVPTAEPASKSEATALGSETILLVEDDPRLRDVSRVYLESKGYKVLEANDASEALRIFQSYSDPIHLLITDVVMPGMDGLELAESALKLKPNLAVILVSGYTDRFLDIESIGVRAHFLQKPFSLDSLARLVRSMIDNGLQGTA